MVGRAYNPALYRFGFNTQEKDNDIESDGNIMTATFWEYDARLGRRWNIDPKASSFESPYMAFRGDPILLSDIHGDVPGPNDKKVGGVGYFFAKMIYSFIQNINFLFRSFGLINKSLIEARESEQYKKDAKYRVQVDLESFSSGLETVIYIEASSRVYEHVTNLSSQQIAKLDLPSGSTFEEGNAIIAAAEKTGATFLTADAEGEAYLNELGADASFMNMGDKKSSILLRPNASRAAILEESIHHGQLVKYGEKYMTTNRVQLEIEAQDELLRIGKKEGWSKSELDRISHAKQTYQAELNKAKPKAHLKPTTK